MGMTREKKIVLLVDDSILILERMIPMLQGAPGIELVVHAGSYKEAIGILECLQPDLILLDIHLPDKSGIDLLQFVHANYQQIIVFMMTTDATDQYRTACARFGAQRFFDKATEFEGLTEAVGA
jgi:DNA-binding NarL/FixJ family response regulator